MTNTTDDFDAQWYLATYPDVALSGLTPQEHYRKFGSALGRAGNAQAFARRKSGVRARPQAASQTPAAVAARFGVQADAAVEILPPAGIENNNPIIAPPPGTPQHQQVARPTLARPAAGSALRLMSGATEISRFASSAECSLHAAPLAAYCQLVGLDGNPQAAFDLFGGRDGAPRVGTVLAPFLAQVPDLGGGALRSGATQIANAWFADEFGLRVLLVDPKEAGSGRAGVLRAYQADPADPAGLRLVGGLMLSGDGPELFDAALLNPLMPVLLELSEKSGLTVDIGLLPFTSLLRGGLHAAERAALQLGPEPMQEVWRLSQALLAEMLPAGPGAPPFSVATVEVDLSGATGGERIFSQSVRGWLAAIFGLAVTPPEGPLPEGSGARYVAEMLGAGAGWPGLRGRNRRRGDGGGLALSLPASAVPTLGALVSRRLALPAGQVAAAGPFLVADSTSCRPQWSVALPWDGHGGSCREDLPVLRVAGGATLPRPAAPNAGTWLAPLHLAIRFAPSLPVNDIHTLLPAAPDMPDLPAAAPAELSVALSVTDPALTRRFLSSLAQQADIAVRELLLCPQFRPDAETVAQLKAMAAEMFARARLVIGPAAGDLATNPDRIIEKLSGARILLAEDSVILFDLRTAARLAALLEAEPRAASVGCVLLHEAAPKGAAQIQVATAGLFPAQVSFIAAPRLGVSEPDCLAALPATTYPVLANSFRLCLLRRAAIAATRAARGALPGASLADLKFGLDSLAAGYQNLCTSTVRAGTTVMPRSRDEIDPFGLACLLPARWDEVLASVTVLRELRG